LEQQRARVGISAADLAAITRNMPALCELHTRLFSLMEAGGIGCVPGAL
jgi:hypothetical protein